MRARGGDALRTAHEEEPTPRLQINADSPQTAKLSGNNVITRADVNVVRQPQRNKRAI